MFRPATRSVARCTAALRAPLPRSVAAPTRRLASTAPPPVRKSRSWKSLAARLGLAGGIVYYYNTTEVFAEEPGRVVVQALPVAEAEGERLPTIEEVARARQVRKAEAEALAAAAAEQEQSKQVAGESASAGGGVEELEQEAEQQGAFNPETGEINWDCPCLGGMADGPCGEEFKAAFSCFVYSTEEPKGMDCIEKFQGMQNCFRQYPEIYGSELDNQDEDDEEEGIVPAEGAPAAAAETAKADLQPTSDSSKTTPTTGTGLVPEGYRPSENTETLRANAATEQVRREHKPVSESESLVPKAAHDSTDANVQQK